MKKRTLSLILALLMVCSLLPVSAAADAPKSGTCGDNLTWTLDDAGVLTISGTGDMYNYPDSNVPWKAYVGSITSVVVESGVTSIGERAFQACTAIKTISLPGSVTSIGKCAFLACMKLESVNIPSGVKVISDFTFSQCQSLKSIKLPEGITSIGNQALQGCDELTSIILPSTVTSIGVQAFMLCRNLKSICIPAGVTKTGYGLFAESNNLTDVYFGGTEAQWKANPEHDALGLPETATVHFGSYYPFTDVDPAGRHAPFAEAIQWAVNEGVTTGYGNGIFPPNADCSRAQVVTFLWRAAGSPAHKSEDNPFVDVFAKQDNGNDNPFYTAILWAVENGITNGVDATHFAPSKTCTRAQVVTFLWRAEGQPEPASAVNPFADVSAKQDNGNDNPFYTAILWAVENGITNGTDSTHFSPDSVCTRAQIVTFIYRDLA